MTFVCILRPKRSSKAGVFQLILAAIKILETILKVLSMERFENAFTEWQRQWN
ncbi:hypothetical protein J6590_104985, partial [Homalodisca vitripennis]